jgi:hypothetical protein
MGIGSRFRYERLTDEWQAEREAQKIVQRGEFFNGFLLQAGIRTLMILG